MRRGIQQMDILLGLEQAEQYIRANQKGQARAILREIIRQFPNCEEAWIMSASVSDTDAQINYCLQQALRINPYSVKAQQAINSRQQAQNPQWYHSEPSPVQPAVPTPQTDYPSYTPRPTPPLMPTSVPSPTYPAMSAVYSSPGIKPVQRYSTKWWLMLLPILGFVLYLLAARYSYFYDRLDDWQLRHFGNTVESDYSIGSEYWHRYHTFSDSLEYKLIRIVSVVMMLCAFLMVAFWFFRGIHGGINLSIKKLRGSGWVILLLFLPIIVFPAYLALMAIFGEFAYGWGKNAISAKKKCPYCKSWIPREANRCQNCAQVIPAGE